MGKRVAIVASLASSLINFRRPLIERLLANGHSVTALAPHCESTARDLRKMGVEFVDVPLSRKAWNLVSDAIFLVALTRIFRRISPEWVFVTRQNQSFMARSQRSSREFQRLRQ